MKMIIKTITAFSLSFLLISLVFAQEMDMKNSMDKNAKKMEHKKEISDPHKDHKMDHKNDLSDPHKDHKINLKKDQSTMIRTDEEKASEVNLNVGIDEKLGKQIDLNIMFTDEKGKHVMLKDYFDKPVVILPVYYFCPTICSYLLSQLATSLNGVNRVPGKDFNVIAFSFSDDEEFTHAADAKKNFVKLLNKEYPDSFWPYLTGSKENIKKFTDQIGYKFTKREKHLYAHPSAIVVIDKTGKVIRYLYGPEFLPFDLGMAVSEAEKGTPGISIRKVINYCFDFDPVNKKYVFKTFRITGSVILGFAVLFFVFLIIKPGQKRIKKEN